MTPADIDMLPVRMLARFLQSAFVVFAASATGCASVPAAVDHVGAMREVMREGRTEARLTLAKAIEQPHVYAVGAMESLSGEVTIVDGDVWIASVVDGAVQMRGPAPAAHDAATLLTHASVPHWAVVEIARPADAQALERAIAEAAAVRGMDVDQPFPFLFKGQVTRLDLHVIDGFCPVGGTPAPGAGEPWRTTIENHPDVTIVGFFARNQAGVLTHHGTVLHMHALVEIDGRLVTGHVDDVAVASGPNLRLPRKW